MGPHEQFRDSHHADVHFLRRFPGRQIDLPAALLEANEYVGVHHQSHGSASAGNPARTARRSWANASLSSPRVGRLRKKALSFPTVRGDASTSSIVRRTSACAGRSSGSAGFSTPSSNVAVIVCIGTTPDLGFLRYQRLHGG